jgi:CubicO group peptidase (beta-lactamase class C family)
MFLATGLLAFRAAHASPLSLHAEGALRSNDAIDRLVRHEMELLHIPGLALEVVRDGKVIKRQGYGSANLETPVNVTPDTVFEIGSTTKQFTAAAIMLLQDRGQLTVEDSLGKYLPDLPEAWKKLTLRQVMTHSAGLKDYAVSSGLSDPAKKRPEQLIEPISKLPFDFEPGTGWAYSNTGFLLAGMVVEKVSKKPLATFLAEQFFKPLGMKTMTSTDPSAVVTGRARGYAFDGKVFTNVDATNPTLATGAGLLMGTVDDLVKWSDSLTPQHLLSLKALEQMSTPVTFADGTTGDYGFGQFLDFDRGAPVVAHGGNTLGFSADLFRVPSKRITIAILTNRYGLNPETLARSILSQVDASSDLAKRAPWHDPYPKLTARLQTWFAENAKGKVDRSLLAPSFLVQFKTLRGLYLNGSFVALGKAAKTVSYLDEDDRGLSAGDAAKLMTFETAPTPKAVSKPQPKSKAKGTATKTVTPETLADAPDLPVPSDRYIRYRLETEDATLFLEIHWTKADQIAWLGNLYNISKPKPPTPVTPQNKPADSRP